MIEQTSEAVNPGQAIYDALSDEAKAAVDALPDDVFADEAGLSAAHQISDSLSRVHSVDPGIWSIQCDSPTNGREWVVLNVANVNVAGADRNGDFGLLIRSVGDLPHEVETLISKHTDGYEYSDSGIKKIVFHGDLWPSLRSTETSTAHDRALEHYSSVGWRKNQRWKWHRDDWRVKLAMLSGKALPAPTYVPKNRYGLPMEQVTGEYADRTAGATVGKVAFGFDTSLALAGGFKSSGLKYTMSQIASFYTALQTKGFVILSGISGTGKSKIAQSFAAMLPRVSAVSFSNDEVGFEGVRLHMKPYMQKYSRFIIPAKHHAELPLPTVGTSLDVRLIVNGKEGEGRIESRQHGDAILTQVFPRGVAAGHFGEIKDEQFLVDFRTDEEAITTVVVSSNWLDNAPGATLREATSDSSTIRVKLTEAALKNRLFGFPWNQASEFPFPPLAPSVKLPVHLPNGTVEGRLENPNGTSGGNGIQLDLTATSNEFVDSLTINEELLVTPLIRDNQVAELEIHRAGAKGTQDQRTGSNHLFLPVRPDWRDGKQLIGYHNPLSGEYVRTDFLDFVIAASDDYRAGNRNAFFVILDEMNLAHVEYYFADVLSVIESGRDEEGWTVEGIPLAVGAEDADLPERLYLPPNLYIVGTVNMDETTHPFSPKVLDRAFTIELSDVDFSGYPPEPPEASKLDDADKQALLQAFTQHGRYPRIDKEDIRSVVEEHERYRDDLQSLNTSLRRSRMHFGYRVFDEIMQFVHNAGQNGLFTADEAFDHAVLMKVLPKFNGSRGKLQTALYELIHWCKQSRAMDAGEFAKLQGQFTTLLDEGKSFDTVVVSDEDSVEDNWRYPATARRAALMMQDLYTDGFASFG